MASHHRKMKLEPPYDTKYFSKWIDSLTKSLQKKLPNISPEFKDACQLTQCCQQAKEAAEKVVAEIQRSKPVDQNRLEKAQALVDKETSAVDDAVAMCQLIANDTLEKDVFQTLLGDQWDDSDLVTATVLKQAGPEKLAAWCAQGDSEAAKLMALLQDPNQMRVFLQGGGARNGEYGRAVQLYVPNPPPSGQRSQFAHRLALAIALELCDPLLQFDSKTEYVDPIKRYVHYEQAYLFGELDPMLDTFQVWELRNVINSDAPDEQLGWGRECLMNFRPDWVYTNDPKWRYCMIVKSDVNYQAPDWYKKPRSYDQILSGGGKCGPRAWYGRFICKAFGIPTWGVQQKGHAAMARWTSTGWTTCLGAAFKWTYWEGRSGLDYQLETQARYALNNDESLYLKRVYRLAMISCLFDEDTNSIKMNLVPTSTALWSSLELLRRKIVVSHHAPCKPAGQYSTNELANRNKIHRIIKRSQKKTERETPVRDPAGVVIIPATLTSNPPHETRRIKFLDSFLGGKQLLIVGKQSVEYELPLDMLASSSPRKYLLKLRVCTVHRLEEPFLVTVTTTTRDGTQSQEDIPLIIPYTMGSWEDTEAVQVPVGGTATTSTKLLVARQSDLQGFSMKELRLIPN